MFRARKAGQAHAQRAPGKDGRLSRRGSFPPIPGAGHTYSRTQAYYALFSSLSHCRGSSFFLSLSLTCKEPSYTLLHRITRERESERERRERHFRLSPGDAQWKATSRRQPSCAADHPGPTLSSKRPRCCVCTVRVCRVCVCVCDMHRARASDPSSAAGPDSTDSAAPKKIIACSV